MYCAMLPITWRRGVGGRGGRSRAIGRSHRTPGPRALRLPGVSGRSWANAVDGAVRWRTRLSRHAIARIVHGSVARCSVPDESAQWLRHWGRCSSDLGPSHQIDCPIKSAR